MCRYLFSIFMTPEWIQAVGLFHYPCLILLPTHFPSIAFSIFPPHTSSLISSIPPTGLFYPGPPFTSHFSPPLLFLKVKPAFDVFYSVLFSALYSFQIIFFLPTSSFSLGRRCYRPTFSSTQPLVSKNTADPSLW